MQAGQSEPIPPPAPPPLDSNANPPKKDNENKEAIKPFELYPLAIVHDFGKVKSGTLAKHAFLLVNTSDVPLKFNYLRCAMGPLTARVSKVVLQPYEEGNLEITLETSRFRGQKKFTVYLQTDNGKVTETRFYITADSQEDPEP